MVVFLLDLKLLLGTIIKTHDQMLAEKSCIERQLVLQLQDQILVLDTRYANPEEAEVFELGAKIYLPNGYLNIAMFDQKIKGFQSNTFVGTGFVLANAGSQSADGVEFDLSFPLLKA